MKTVKLADFPNPQAFLAVTCLVYLIAHGVESVEPTKDAVSSFLDDPDTPFLRYAYQEWPEHVRRTQEERRIPPYVVSFLSHCTQYPFKVPASLRPERYTRLWGLHLAARYGLSDAISPGKLPCPPSDAANGHTPFHFVVSYGNVKALETLIKSYGTKAGDATSLTEDGHTALALIVDKSKIAEIATFLGTPFVSRVILAFCV